MREILFRGKQVNKDKWAYGLPIKGTAVDESEILIIQSVFQCDEYVCRGCDFEPIIPETVGQYTGLTDKNGKKIFEGDIVQSIELELRGVIIFDEYCRFMIKDITTQATYLTARNNEDIVVIGNIHDNPELLKGENDA